MVGNDIEVVVVQELQVVPEFGFGAEEDITFFARAVLLHDVVIHEDRHGPELVGLIFLELIGRKHLPNHGRFRGFAGNGWRNRGDQGSGYLGRCFGLGGSGILRGDRNQGCRDGWLYWFGRGRSNAFSRAGALDPGYLPVLVGMPNPHAASRGSRRPESTTRRSQPFVTGRARRMRCNAFGVEAINDPGPPPETWVQRRQDAR